MKRIIIALVALLFTFNIQAQQKAFGDICFGMTPKEVRKAYKADKEKHSLKIGGWNFLTNVNVCEFDKDGLIQVSLWAQELSFAKKLTSVNADKLLVDIKEVFLTAGYEVSDQHVFWPKTIVMRYEPHCLVLKNDESKKLVKVRIDKDRKSFDDRYPIWIDILPFSYLKKIAEKNREKAEEINDKL
jgi:hypothetical protein